MKKKMFSTLLAITMLMCCLPAQAYESNEAPSGEETVITSETETSIITEIYVGDVLSQRAVTDKESTETVAEIYTDNEVIRQTYILSEHIEDVDLASLPAPAVELEPTYSYDIYKRIRTDYLYQGAIMYGDTYTMAHETSRSDRYEGHTLQFGAGTAFSVIYNAIKIAMGVTVNQAMLVELGFEIATGVLLDSITTTVCFTKYYVATKVYFDGVLTVFANNTYDDILVSAGAGGVDHYSTGLLGYDVVSSWASYCCSSGAVAFRDKYVTMNNPSLSLPITSLPYYGY